MFNITRKSDPHYAGLVQSLAEAKVIEQFDYNALGQAYNGLDQGEVVDFPFKRDKQTSLIQQLHRRGLERNVDYRIVFDGVETENVLKDEAGNELKYDDGTPQFETIPTAFITRLSAKEATMVVKTRGKRGEEEGAELTDEPIPPSGTSVNTDTTDGDAADAGATPANSAPSASLGTPVARTGTAPAKKGAAAPAAPAKKTTGTAPAKPAGKR